MRSFILAIVLVVSTVSGAKASEMWLTIDFATYYSSDRTIGSIVVGNPSVADVTVRSHREIVLFGKSPGATNMTLFDTKGRPIETLSLRVKNPQNGRITLQAGVNRYTFSCTTLCEQTNTIGDGSNESRAALASVDQQTTQKLTNAGQAGSEGPSTVAPAQMPFVQRNYDGPES